MSVDSIRTPRSETRRVLVALAVLTATVVGGFALVGPAAAAENVHDGSLKDPATGETVTSVEGGNETKIKYGYEIDNVTNTGESVYLYLAFPDQVNSTSGLSSPGSFQANVTCKCGGSNEDISISSSPSAADGPDGDGVQEMIKIGIQPNKRDKPIDLIVNMTGPATYPNVTNDTTYDLRAYAEESASSGQNTDATFANITVTADGSGSSGGSTDDSQTSSDDPQISNFEATANGDGTITVTFDSDETLADIEVDVRGAEDGTLHTEDFDGNEFEGYTATYQAGTDGDYTLELVTAKDTGGDDGADDGDYVDTASVTGASDGTSGSETPTSTDTGDTDGSTSDDSTSDDTTSTDDGTSTDDTTSDDSTSDDSTSTDDGDSSGSTDDGSSSGDSGSSTDDGSSGGDGEGTSTSETGDDSSSGDADTGGGDAGSGDAASPTEDDGAGFGVILALVSVLAGALLVVRRR